MLGLIDGLIEGEILLPTEGLVEGLIDGDMLGLDEGETDTDGLTDGDIDTDGLTLGLLGSEKNPIWMSKWNPKRLADELFVAIR